MITGLCLHRTAKCTLLIRSVDHDITTFGFLTTRKIVHSSLALFSVSVSVSSSFCSFLLLFSSLISFVAYRLKPASFLVDYTHHILYIAYYVINVWYHSTHNVHNKFLSLAKVKYHLHIHNNNINELMKGFFHVPKNKLPWIYPVAGVQAVLLPWLCIGNILSFTSRNRAFSFVHRMCLCVQFAEALEQTTWKLMLILRKTNVIKRNTHFHNEHIERNIEKCVQNLSCYSLGFRLGIGKYSTRFSILKSLTRCKLWQKVWQFTSKCSVCHPEEVTKRNKRKNE